MIPVTGVLLSSVTPAHTAMAMSNTINPLTIIDVARAMVVMNHLGVENRRKRQRIELRQGVIRL